MLQPNRYKDSKSYRYGFQGQETDDEIKGEGNAVNYKYRMHDPRLGRFFAVDPLAAKYPYYSSYQFSGNRLVDMVELEGLEPAEAPYKNKEGTQEKAVDRQKVDSGNFDMFDLFNGSLRPNWIWHNGEVTQEDGNKSNAGWYKKKDYDAIVAPDAVNYALLQGNVLEDSFMQYSGSQQAYDSFMKRRGNVTENYESYILELGNSIINKANYQRAFNKSGLAVPMDFDSPFFIPGLAGRLFSLSKSRVSVNEILKSSSIIKKGNTTRGVQALSKKVGRRDAPYIGIKVNKENVEKIIEDVMTAKGRVDKVTRNQQGKEVLDFFNPKTNQGVRLLKETKEFDTFINYNN
jgi:RHS repeat-associated protein